MSTDLESKVIVAIQKGRKIEAIKKLRELHGIELKEAKQLVEAYCDENNISPRPSKSGSSGWIIPLILFGLMAYVFYRYFG